MGFLKNCCKSGLGRYGVRIDRNESWVPLLRNQLTVGYVRLLPKQIKALKWLLISPNSSGIHSMSSLGQLNFPSLLSLYPPRWTPQASCTSPHFWCIVRPDTFAWMFTGNSTGVVFTNERSLGSSKTCREACTGDRCTEKLPKWWLTPLHPCLEKSKGITGTLCLAYHI